MKLRVAVIGAGGIATSHFEAIGVMDRLEAVAVADINIERAEEIAKEYDIAVYVDYKEMVLKQKPDLVVITLPHFLHMESAVYCANQGCHIMLEKPMALNIQECDEIIAAAETNQIQLMIGHTQHYISTNQKAKQLIAEEDLGELVMINDTRHVNYFRSNRPDWFLEKEKSGGGIMMNLGSHSVDKIQWITNSKIAKVKSKLSFYGDRGNVEGSGLLFLETDEGVPVTIAQSGYKGVSKDQTDFIFTKGMVKLITGSGLWISRGHEFHEIKVEQTVSPMVMQFDELIYAIDGEKPINCTGTYGRMVINVIEAIYRSHEMGMEISL
jgi:predicted dehydrogenase